jgi:hypothetical protein
MRGDRAGYGAQRTQRPHTVSDESHYDHPKLPPTAHLARFADSAQASLKLMRSVPELGDRAGLESITGLGRH